MACKPSIRPFAPSRLPPKEDEACEWEYTESSFQRSGAACCACHERTRHVAVAAKWRALMVTFREGAACCAATTP